MASTITPSSGQISFNDLDKSIVQNWTGNTSNQSMNNYRNLDFNPSAGSHGFAYCFGFTYPGNPFGMTPFYNLLGYINYKVTASGVDAKQVTVTISTGTGSNGPAPSSYAFDVSTGNLPNGNLTYEGAHWSLLDIQIVVSDWNTAFDVRFDGNYIDTISSDGTYNYTNLDNSNGNGTMVELLLQ